MTLSCYYVEMGTEKILLEMIDWGMITLYGSRMLLTFWRNCSLKPALLWRGTWGGRFVNRDCDGGCPAAAVATDADVDVAVADVEAGSFVGVEFSLSFWGECCCLTSSFSASDDTLLELLSLSVPVAFCLLALEDIINNIWIGRSDLLC